MPEKAVVFATAISDVQLWTKSFPETPRFSKKLRVLSTLLLNICNVTANRLLIRKQAGFLH